METIMKGLLADINVKGHLDILLMIWNSAEWQELWQRMALQVHVFRDLGLPPRAPDNVVWHECQARQLVLITGNRNQDGPLSLETTLNQHNMPTSLPVITLASPERIRHEASYAARVAEQVLDYLLDIENLRGTGRLYAP
jgi:hypothetical protein